MNVISTRRTLAALLVLTAAAGASAAYAQEEADTGRAAQPAALTNAEVEALFRARQDSARMRFTEADVEFVTGMISHHAQALVMSELAPSHGASPSVQTLAARIINAQQDEIALMQRWLADRGQPVPQVRDAHLEHDAHGSREHHMPGMLTQEQLEELAAAFGREYDRLFLSYMIQHHAGAVTMVDDLFAVDGAGQDGAVFKLASDVQVDQITEIARMQGMLDALNELAERDGGR